MQGPPEATEHETEESSGYFTEINVTPLTDVFLVLLIIFMVVASASVEAERSNAENDNTASEKMPNERALRVQTPQGASDGAIMSKNLVVNVLPDGSIDLDGESVTTKTIGAKLAALDAEHDDQVVIRGDKSAQYELIVAVLSAVRTAGWNRVALATRAP
jgi:biopolymer transport protein ExbD